MTHSKEVSIILDEGSFSKTLGIVLKFPNSDKNVHIIKIENIFLNMFLWSCKMWIGLAIIK